MKEVEDCKHAESYTRLELDAAIMGVVHGIKSPEQGSVPSAKRDSCGG